MTVHQGPLWVECYGDGADHPTLLAFEVDGAIDPVLVAVLSLPDPSFGAFSADGALLHLVGEGSPGSVTTVDLRALLSGDGRRRWSAPPPVAGHSRATSWSPRAGGGWQWRTSATGWCPSWLWDRTVSRTAAWSPSLFPTRPG